MTDLEHRLVDLGRSIEPSPERPPRAGIVLDRARRRRARRLVGATGTAALSIAVLVLVATSLSPSTEELNVASTSGGARSKGVSPTTPAATTPEVGPGVWVVGVDGTGLRLVGKDHGPMAWSPAGDTLAIGVDGWIWKLGVDDPDAATTVPVGAPSLTCLDWSSLGDLAWVTAAGEVRVASGDDARGEVVARGLGPRTASCRWSPDGTRLAIDGDDLTFLRRDGSLVRRWTAPRPRTSVSALSWSPDGSRVTAIATDAATSVDRVVVLDPSAASSAAVELDSPDGREIRSSSWDRRGALYVQTGTGESTAQFLVDEGSRRATRIEAASCCRLLAALGDGGFVGLSPVDGDERKALVRVDAAFAPVEVLARAQGSRAGMPAADECGGTYLLGTRVSPDGRVVAFAASASYGPRCEVLAD